MTTVGIAAVARTVMVTVLAAGAALGLAGTAYADTAPSGGRLYGNPTAAAPYWRYQAYEDDCVEMATADVIGQLTGHEPTEQAIIGVAQSTRSTVHPGPIYTKPASKSKAGSGTSFADEPALLAHYGIHAVSKTGGMGALEQALAAGHKVMAGVNAELIWGEAVKGKPRANHAVVVTGVDTAAGIVHLNDSGSKHGRDERVPIDVFVRSWATSDDQMTVTS